LLLCHKTLTPTDPQIYENIQSVFQLLLFAAFVMF